MSDAAFSCPNCGTSLNESLAGPLIERLKADHDQRLAALRTAMADQAQKLAADREAMERTLQARLTDERRRIAEAEARRAADRVGDEVRTLKEQVADLGRLAAERAERLADAQKAQAEILRRERLLEDEKRKLDVTVESRVNASLAELRQQALADAEGALRLKLDERDLTIAQMKHQIEEMKRKAEQGSQQLQGEVLELRLESELAARFPMDQFEPVAKGDSGADLVHRVTGPAATGCGAILWEVKRTRAWNDAWLPKLRQDQRSCRAEVAVLLSEALPRGHQTLDLVDGVWIAHPRHAIPVALALRQMLVELAAVRRAEDGQETKMQLVYAYLTGPRFRHRIEAIVERFDEMAQDLSRERKAMTKLWARREKQIEAVVGATVGMYGDLQGIAGRAMGDIPALELAGQITDETPELGDDPAG